MLELYNLIKSILKYAAPIIIGAFSLLTVYAMFKWTNRIKNAWAAIWSNPILIVFWIVLAVFMYILFKNHVLPVLD